MIGRGIEIDMFPVQVLGSRGITFPCIEAIVTMLTSVNPPSSFTVIYDSNIPRNQAGVSVAFVAWDWPDARVTVVPNGFTTNSGTGSWGLSICLSLIQSSQIPINEAAIPSASFERLCNAIPTDRDISLLKDRISSEFYVAATYKKRS